MSKQREALKIALEVLDSKHNFNSAEWRYLHYRAFQIIREALAEPEQEPVADVDLYAVWSNGFHSRKPDMEPLPWSTRERFYEAVDRAVENVRQEMRIKTVTMRLPKHEVAMPIIDEHRGHVLVGPMVARKPLTDEEIAIFAALLTKYQVESIEAAGLVDFARAIERAHGITE